MESNLEKKTKHKAVDMELYFNLSNVMKIH